MHDEAPPTPPGSVRPVGVPARPGGRSGAQPTRGWTAIPAGVDSAVATMRPPSTTTTTAIAVAAGTLFAVLTILVGVRWSPLNRFDIAAAAHTAAVLRGHATLVELARVLAVILSPWVALGAAFVLALVLFRQGARRLAAWLALTAALTYVVCALVKALLERPRPGVALTRVHEASFPSTHATMSIAVTSAFLIVAVLSWPAFRWFARSLTVGLVLLTSADRLLLGVHYPTDVVGGWLLAATMLSATMLSFGVSPVRRKAGREWAIDEPRPQVAVVYNPTKITSQADFRELVSTAAEMNGYAPPRWYETRRDDPGQTMTRDALADGADLVLAAGGDGTVRIVAAELAGSGVPLGIIAAGSGNLLARNFALPLEQPEAIDVAMRGRDVPMDLVKVSGAGMIEQRFAVLAGLGLDAAIIDDTADELKKNVGWMAYVVAGTRHLSFPAIEVDITVDDLPARRFRARSVMIGNVGMLTGGVTLLPHARIDDGVMDAVVVAPGNVADWTRVAYRVLTRRHRGDAKLDFLSGRRMTVRVVDAQPVPRQLDGDLVPPGAELVCEVEPSVLQVRVARR